jgi:hypothetical protein
MSSNLGLTFDMESDKFQLGICNFDVSMRELLFSNPHCIEYFCVFDNCKNCSQCYKYLKQKYDNYYDRYNTDTEFTIKDKNILFQLASVDKNECDDKCFVKNGIIYGIKKQSRDDGKYMTHNIDMIKGIMNKKNFERKELNTNVFLTLPILNKLDPDKKISYELTIPKNKTVIKWGQLKLFLEVLFSFVQKFDAKDKIVHVIYAGSAPGTSLIILCKLFPSLRLYLIDPRQQAPDLIGHSQVVEIKNEYFTDDTAKYYYKRMAEPKKRNEKVIFMSDIRIYTDDASINKDNKIQADWHEIIKPHWSFLKFRCPYEATNNKIQYFDAEYYFQPYAPASSTETRVFVPTGCKMMEIDVNEYQRICLFHNRILRPSCYNSGVNHKYFDKCFDCSFFKQIMEDYNKKFPKYFIDKKLNKIEEIMEYICNNFEKTNNKLEVFTNSLKTNLIK